MPSFQRVVIRFVLVWIIETLTLLVIAQIVPGITITGTDSKPALFVAVSVPLVLGIINVLVQPVLLLLTLPINVRTLGVATLVVNAVMLRLTAELVTGFVVTGWAAAILGALALTAVNTVFSSLASVDDDHSFFQGMVERLSRIPHLRGTSESGRGLVMLEIDGLSYSRLKRAVERGYLPTVREMLRDGSYTISCCDCGLPSQTSSCQAGILFGDNFDIPAFRWYDKDQRKTMVSNNFRDAAALNSRYSKGAGLLRGGSSIVNLLAGDAEKSLLTMGALLGNNPEELNRRAEDLNLFFFTPSLFARSVILSFCDIAVELFQANRQRVLKVQPHINRLKKGYPFMRAVTNVFLRDLGSHMVTLDLLRGAPVIYMTWVGYDEVAHHAGPDTPDALSTLRAFDKVIRNVRETILNKAPRPYDLIVLADHGQSAGATFKRRYGHTLQEFIAAQVSSETSVRAVEAQGIHDSYAATLLVELQNMEQRAVKDRFLRATVRQANRVLSESVGVPSETAVEPDAHILVCPSGNFANIYFLQRDGKVSLTEMNAAHPGLVDALVSHPGIGFVVTYDDDRRPMALGKNGARHLHTGDVTGTDPLRPYGDPELRAAQVRRVADFPHAGDLIVNSTLYADGSVAAFEELVGSHGGLGGDQTDAFIFHPTEMNIPPTRNSAEIFPLLNARRSLVGSPASSSPVEPINVWSPAILWRGLHDWQHWLPRTFRALLLESSVYAEVARNPFATGPALFIAVSAILLHAVLFGQVSSFAGLFQEIVGWGLGWLIGVFVVQTTAYAMGGKGLPMATFRALAFAQSTAIVLLLGLIPLLGPTSRVVALVFGFISSWIAIKESQKLGGWRMIWVPFISAIVLLISTLIVVLWATGTQVTWPDLLLRLGLNP